MTPNHLLRHALAAALPSVLVACAATPGDNNSPDTDEPGIQRISVEDYDPAGMKASLMADIDLPAAGTYLTTENFWQEVTANDPMFGRRCATGNDALLAEVGDRLGGVRWGHAVRQLIDEGQPKLFNSRFPDEEPAWGFDAASGASEDSDGGVTIERPDLVGYRDGYAVFLSNTHGLLLVDLNGEAPHVSCALQLPGEPLNFFARGNAFVVNINAVGEAYYEGSALLHFTFDAEAFELIDAPFFENERLVDARSFTDDVGQALAVYTNVFEQIEEVIEQPSDSCGEDGCPEPQLRSWWQQTGAVRLNVLNWDTALSAVFTDEFQNDDIGALETTLVDLGETPEAGQHVYSYQSFHNFLSASDRYLVIPQRGTDRFVDRIVHYTRQRCIDYNPQWREKTRCYANYERQLNPDYEPPAPSGDYDCDGASLEACIQQAAPVVSQYIYVRTGETCHDYWVGRCEGYETYSGSYPEYRDEKKTRYIVYRFQNGAFSRLDDTLFELDPSAADGDSSVSFAEAPFELDGHISKADHIQFQNGYLYVLSSGELHTFRLEGSTAIRTGRIQPMNTWGSTWRAEQALIRYSGDRAMISKTGSSWDRSDIISLSLTAPYRPFVNNTSNMPGRNTQILVSDHGYVAPGQVQIPMGGNYTRSLQKLTLHAREDTAELDNLLLGTEFNSLGQTYLAGDDQALRLDGASQRLFAPFWGYHHVTYAPSYLLSISQIASADMTSMGTLEMSEPIVRTVGITADEALAFGNSSVHRLTLGREDEPGLWRSEVVEEIFVATAGYRFDDEDRHARLERFSQKCRISTVESREVLFAESSATSAHTLEVPCLGSPQAIGRSIVFAESQTGATWNELGEELRALSADEVLEHLSLTEFDFYCTIDPATVAEYVPARMQSATAEELEVVACFNYPEWAADGNWGWYW